MRRDGRGFDHRTLEAIRLMAVERVRDGERPSSVVASFGFHRTTIYKWLSAAAKPGVGLQALHSRPATGRPRSLTPRQEQQVFAGSTAAIRDSMAWISGCGRGLWWPP
jgi:transposase